MHYFIANPNTLTEDQCDAINVNQVGSGVTRRWVPKIRHSDGRVGYEFSDFTLSQLGTEASSGVRVCTDQQASIIQANLLTEDQMFSDGWCPLDNHGVRVFTYE